MCVESGGVHSENHTEHINSVWAECRVVLNRTWYVYLLLDFKRLIYKICVCACVCMRVWTAPWILL